MQLRYAKRSDLRKVAAFKNQCWRWAYKNILDADVLAALSDRDRYQKSLKGFKNGRQTLLLYDDNAKLAGICGFGTSNTKGYPQDGEISAIYLREDVLGKGYGHALLQSAENIMCAQDYAHIVLAVLSENKRAIEFYRRHGYDKVADDVFQIGGRSYALDIMRKELPC